MCAIISAELSFRKFCGFFNRAGHSNRRSMRFCLCSSIHLHFLRIMARKSMPERCPKNPVAAIGRTASAIMVSIMRSIDAFAFSGFVSLTL